MTSLRRPFLILLLTVLLALAGCQRNPIWQREFYAMGTLVSVEIYGLPEDTAERAMDRVENDFQAMHHAWHAWEGGPLVQLNQALARGETVQLPDVLAPLIPPAIRLANQSDNLFNPALGRLFRLWGFQGNERHQPPDPQAIQAILDQHPRMSDLVLESQRIRSTNPAVQIDLGGFAKGWAVDRVIEELRQQGVKNAIVNAGGDLRAIGRHGQRPWRIGIRNPRGEGAIAAVEVSGDESVFTSGDYERYFEYQGQRYHHILDPRSGRPARGTRSLTVIYPEAATADAAATALFVAGDDWPRIAHQLGVTQVLRIRSDGVAEMSPAMAAHLEWIEKPVQKPVIRRYNPGLPADSPPS